MNDETPRAVWEGTFTLMGVPLRCYTLADGRRIINADDVAALFEHMGGGDDIDPQALQMELDEFSKWRMAHD